MHPSMTTGRLLNEITRDRTALRVAARKRAALPLHIDDEASEWLAPETIVARAFHDEDRIARLVARQKPRKTLVPAISGQAMSIVAVIFTAAILLTLVV